jgi:hypothetical protein
MRIHHRLSTKFFSFGLGMLLLALLSIGLTMWITRQFDGVDQHPGLLASFKDVQSLNFIQAFQCPAF